MAAYGIRRHHLAASMTSDATI
ncbi:hypothetical protein CCACVL1_09193 [Corchorus capsularis]|uniref:Uncharacterized protein n=1 Tax=Corchorus capsularis TaxID=210143 RepID=A0A1R3IXB6_COCAP|nr:hypothetical protein CCACVL1_09193 [Corchorus capsularis]